MPTKLFVITAATGAIAALATLAASAATATASSSASPAAKFTHAAVHLTAYSDNDGPTETVIVTGAVGDHGQAVSVNPDGSVNPEHNSQLDLRLAHGTFRLDIAALDKSFVAAMAAQFPSNTTTCSGSVDVTQRVPIVPNSGTGAYQGIAGEFTVTVALDEVDKVGPAEPCSASSAFLSQTIVTSGSGKVSY